MKTFKNILIGLFSLILINLICLLILSFNTKTILVNGVIKEVIKTQIIPKNTNNNQVDKLLNSKETEELINKYLDKVIINVTDDKELDEEELKKDIIKYLRNNKDKLSKITNKEITDVDIDNIEKELYIKNINKNINNSSRIIPKESKIILQGYNSFVSQEFRTILMILIVINILIIGLIEWSLYKWIKTLSKAMITSGVLITIMSLIVMIIVSLLSPLKVFKANSLLITGIIVLVIGIIILVIYNLLVKEENKDEVSQVS